MTPTPVSAATNPLQSLTQAFLLNYPLGAARKLEAMSPEEAASILREQKVHVSARVLDRLAPRMTLAILLELPDALVAGVLESMDVATVVGLLSQAGAERREGWLGYMGKATAEEFRTLLEYPENSVGQLMNPAIFAFNKSTTAGQALAQLRRQQVQSLPHLFLLNDDMTLHARVDLKRLILADTTVPLAQLAAPVQVYVQALDPREEVLEKLNQHEVDVLPVVDVDFRLVGVVEGQDLLHAVKQDIVTDMQTMVGVSKDERALSSSLFAVRKRLPWLQVNLLTAFLASAVVGIFESTIAQFTALAVLLPVAAGQSGNTGAQALAVTMRGLTLREITLRHWYRVALKELAAGFMNGLGVAATCSLGVYLWSRSSGLALVMALAMVASMTIAGIAGALVPIGLKRFGLDPAQASSIVLTTVTDIAGFLSFLGIATLLAAFL
jgi:magnesium transporter